MQPALLFSSDADRDGPGRRSLASRCRSGELLRLRPGVYVSTIQWENLPRWEREITKLTAAAEQGRNPRVLVQESAAIAWGIPTIGSSNEIMVLASVPSHARRRGGIRWVERRLLEPLSETSGFAVTSRAQTVLDMAAYLSFERAVPAMDHVLRPDLGRGLAPLNKTDLRDLAQALPTQAKRTRAVRIIDFADKRSESPGESFSRAVLHRLGFPPPDLQKEFRSAGGRVLGRTDFFWPQQNLVGEFDGAVKYGAALNGADGQSQQTLLQEKRREDAIRATGVGFVRWTWADVLRPPQEPDGLTQILTRAGLPRTRRRG